MRYLPLTDHDRSAMLNVIGAPSVEALFSDVPESARLTGPVHGLPNHATELSVERHLSALARKNRPAGDGPFFLGCGAYKHHVPASVDHIIQRQFEKPPVTFGRGVDQCRFTFERGIAFGHGARHRRIYVRRGLDRFDDGRIAALGHFGPRRWHFDENDIAQLLLRMVGNSDDGGGAVNVDPFMVCREITHQALPFR